MPTVKIGWSGGKDSTCAILRHLARGDTVKAVCYIPMFNNEIPLITKKHYEFIIYASGRLQALGAEIHIVTGVTYFANVTRKATRGKNKGKILGFPSFHTQWCSFKRDSKIKALSMVDVGYYDYESIGICADEKERHNQLSTFKRSILVEEGLTQGDTKRICLENHLLSPHYTVDFLKRDGCALCPHAKRSEREKWFNDYPDAIPLVHHLQEVVKKERPEQSPLRNHQWFI